MSLRVHDSVTQFNEIYLLCMNMFKTFGINPGLTSQKMDTNSLTMLAFITQNVATYPHIKASNFFIFF